MKLSIYHIRDFTRKVSRILVSTAFGFVKNNDSLKASALTFLTLVSIVPFLAVAFGIASGFGFAEYLESQLTKTFEDQPEIIDHAILFARSLLKSTQGSLIAGIGVITLLWTNISMLGTIENALNDIWQVKKPRTWIKKITDYLAAMIIGPLFFVVSSSLSVYIATQITETAKENQIIEIISPFLLFFLKLIPFVLSILLFIVIYLFVPNTEVRYRPRIIAGILAGVAFQAWQWIYIHFQVQLSSYNVVYGTFAALPLFLIWLQVSWLIFLAGAELGAHIEDEMSQTFQNDNEEIHKISKRELGLLILESCIKAFSRGNPPKTALQLAKEFGIPLFTAQQMIDTLEEGGMLVEVGTRGDTNSGYQPSKDPSLFTVKSVCDAIDEQTEWHVVVENSPALERILHSLKEFDRLAEESKDNLNLEDFTKLDSRP